MSNENERSVERLLEILDLEPVATDHFRAETDQDEGRLFGGLILAQTVVAAGRTAQGNIHSLHAYFLRAGRPATPVEYVVERIREGRTFLTRRVTAMQGGDAIFEASVGYTLPEEGIAHQAPMPDVPGPEGQPLWWDTLKLDAPPMQRRRRWNPPIEVRSAGPEEAGAGSERLPSRAVWTRPFAPIPDDPVIHAAFMAYMSDTGLVGTVAAPYRIWGTSTGASLDHAIWWHRPPRFDDWILYTSESPAAHSARAIIFAAMYSRDGVRVASVAQEALFRETKRA
jgi:acyl-CoA thioesterase-2